MAKLLRLRRGTDTQHTTFTGAEGEVTVNTTNDSIHVHDGSTAGGRELARADLSNVSGTTEGAIDVTGSVTCDGLTAYAASGDLTANFQSNNNNAILEVGGGTGGYIDFKSPFSDNYDLRIFSTGTGGNIYTNNGNVSFNTNVVPTANNSHDLGTSSLQWKDAYFDGTVNCDDFSCPTTVTAGSYGSASAIPNFTVDSSGRLTAAGTSALNNASETVSGIVELATAAETTTGTSTTRAVHPAGLKVELDKKLDEDISSLPTLP